MAFCVILCFSCIFLIFSSSFFVVGIIPCTLILTLSIHFLCPTGSKYKCIMFFSFSHWLCSLFSRIPIFYFKYLVCTYMFLHRLPGLPKHQKTCPCQVVEFRRLFLAVADTRFQKQECDQTGNWVPDKNDKRNKTSNGCATEPIASGCMIGWRPEQKSSDTWAGTRVVTYSRRKYWITSRNSILSPSLSGKLFKCNHFDIAAPFVDYLVSETPFFR